MLKEHFLSRRMNGILMCSPSEPVEERDKLLRSSPQGERVFILYRN